MFSRVRPHDQCGFRTAHVEVGVQLLPSVSPREDSLVICRSRRWLLGRSNSAAVDHPDVGPESGTQPRLLDLQPQETPAMGALRLLSPPDAVRLVPARTWTLRPRAWARSLGAVRARVPGDDPPDAAMRALVRPLAYQWVPLLALRSGYTRRLLLADEVGMGKTVQAGLVLADIHDRMAAARTLTVVPASLLGQWRDELEERFSLTATILDSAALAASTAATPGDPAPPGDAYLISIDTLRLPEVTSLLDSCDWQLVVVDEAHLLAPGSARRDAVTRLARRASRLLLLTATPFTGADVHDRHLLSVGRRSADSSADRMLVVARRAATLGRAPLTQRVAWLTISAGEARLHAQLDAYVARALRETAEDAAGRLAAFLLRRRACSSIPALARSVQHRLDVLGTTARYVDTQLALPLEDEHDPAEEWLRAPAWSNLDAERACLEAIRAQARACRETGAKPRWLVRWLTRCREPVLVFTEYADTLRALRQVLPSFRRVACLYGAQTTDQRRLAITLFCSGEADVLLATDAAAEGLNLHQRCRLVVHMDVPWSPRRLAQRNGRLDRLGQTRAVRATIVAGRGTFDRDVLKRLSGRQQLVESARAGAHRDLATVASPRRDRVAFEVLRRCTTGAPDATRSLQHDVLQAWVAPRRWRGIAARLGVPAGYRALMFAELCLGGLHPLVRSRLWVSGAAREVVHAHALSCADIAAWPTIARFVRRARGRSTRLESLDAAVRAAAPRPLAPDLFADRQAPRDHDVTAGRPATAVALQLLAMRVLSWRR